MTIIAADQEEMIVINTINTIKQATESQPLQLSMSILAKDIYLNEAVKRLSECDSDYLVSRVLDKVVISKVHPVEQ